MEIPGADISVSTSMDYSLAWNFHMSCAAMDVFDWLLQLAPALYKDCSRRSVIPQLLSAYSSRFGHITQQQKNVESSSFAEKFLLKSVFVGQNVKGRKDTQNDF